MSYKIGVNDRGSLAHLDKLGMLLIAVSEPETALVGLVEGVSEISGEYDLDLLTELRRAIKIKSQKDIAIREFKRYILKEAFSFIDRGIGRLEVLSAELSEARNKLYGTKIELKSIDELKTKVKYIMNSELYRDSFYRAMADEFIKRNIDDGYDIEVNIEKYVVRKLSTLGSYDINFVPSKLNTIKLENLNFITNTLNNESYSDEATKLAIRSAVNRRAENVIKATDIGDILDTPPPNYVDPNKAILGALDAVTNSTATIVEFKNTEGIDRLNLFDTLKDQLSKEISKYRNIFDTDHGVVKELEVTKRLCLIRDMSIFIKLHLEKEKEMIEFLDTVISNTFYPDYIWIYNTIDTAVHKVKRKWQ